ncbi:hypothetical protein R3P38DRAFT_1022571 [Favolaschia claudopus]|uniref:F-box domain-containing protein n=1 Tax=Favolaschia claudopus TaxID=2862362 RepID=A0AAW0BJ39_9AGAR
MDAKSNDLSCSINDLPYELISYIFYLARLNDPYRLGVPVELASVCSHWRRTALNTPRLWSAQEFPFSETNTLEIPLNRLFLERSAPLPVRVRLVGVNNAFATLLLHTPQRWKSLMLFPGAADAKSFCAFLASIPPHNLESLESVTVQYLEMTAEQYSDVSFVSHLPPIPWAQLTRLSLTHVSAQDCIDLLGRSERLVSAEFYAREWSESWSEIESQRTFVLEHMDKLVIYLWIFPESQGFNSLLCSFTFPALKTLSLAYFFEENDFERCIVADIIPFLIRTPTLECLRLANHVSSDEIQRILRYAPGLTELQSRLGGGNEELDNLFQALCYEPGTSAPPLAPQLKVLRLWHIGSHVDEKILAKMIRSRWWSDGELDELPRPLCVARWKRIELEHTFAHSFSREFESEMDIYRSQGLVM